MSDGAAPTFQYDRRPDGTVYRQSTDDKRSRQCQNCNSWIGLGPNGGEYSYRLHVGSSACTKAKNALENSHATAKHSGNTRLPGAPSSFSTASLPPTLSPSNTLPLQHPPHLPPPSSASLLSLYPSPLGPPPSFPPHPWSAPGSPQLFSSPLPLHSRTLVLPSLALEPATPSPQVPTLSPAKQDCRGSLVLWESGDPATTYPYNLHSTNHDDTTRLPWQAMVGERSGSVRLRSNECQGTHIPSKPCCDMCAKIQSSARFQKIVDWARTDHKHRAYNKINWEQAVERARDKTDQLMKERTKVRSPNRNMYSY